MTEQLYEQIRRHVEAGEVIRWLKAVGKLPADTNVFAWASRYAVAEDNTHLDTATPGGQ